ncbi:hypothetical protein NUW58_g3707 [Xylaria curta]|uniref:Uncharacterized protein n=1 Tax=Xylaria curta TaxID=42375 RepID=A0ACC1PBC9_9PEZI|nr:hypothetical protein NUW58_g3707 [Xylaria curta]
MSVGTLHASIILSEPGKIHCGSRDPVLGHVSIRYAPGNQNPSAELFGPLQVFVTLHGRAKTKLWKSNGQSTSIYRGRAPLIARRVVVYDDPFRAQPGDTANLPFSLRFPEVTDAIVGDDFEDDPRYIIHPSQPLPPSFNSSYHGFAHRYEAFVEYRIGVDVFMPQLQVGVSKPTEYGEPVVLYERPRFSHPVQGNPFEWRGFVSVKNELLLPEADRPSGFRQKTKAFLGAGNFPTYAFDWLCLTPKDIHLGQPACFEVKIKPREHECTATLIPEVRLQFFRFEIKAHTQVRATRTFFSCPTSEGNYTVCETLGAIDNREPFSKANEYTKIINTDALGGSFGSTFATYNISHAYTAKITFALEVTGKVKNISEEYGIMVHPPLETAPPPAASTPGPSHPPNAKNTASDPPLYDEPLPPYHQASSSTG